MSFSVELKKKKNLIIIEINYFHGPDWLVFFLLFHHAGSLTCDKLIITSSICRFAPLKMIPGIFFFLIFSHHVNSAFVPVSSRFHIVNAEPRNLVRYKNKNKKNGLRSECSMAIGNTLPKIFLKLILTTSSTLTEVRLDFLFQNNINKMTEQNLKVKYE